MNAADCALILLAAGQSRRFGAADKLLAELDGKPVFHHALETAVAAGFGHYISAVSCRNAALLGPLKTHGFKPVFNGRPEDGPGRSLSLAAKAVPDGMPVMVMLADMPYIRPAHIHTLLRAAQPCGIVYSEYGESFGPPALFCGAAAQALTTLHPARGAKALRTDFPSRAIALPLEEARDIDTPQDLARLNC